MQAAQPGEDAHIPREGAIEFRTHKRPLTIGDLYEHYGWLAVHKRLFGTINLLSAGRTIREKQYRQFLGGEWTEWKRIPQ